MVLCSVQAFSSFSYPAHHCVLCVFYVQPQNVEQLFVSVSGSSCFGIICKVGVEREIKISILRRFCEAKPVVNVHVQCEIFYFLLALTLIY